MKALLHMGIFFNHLDTSLHWHKGAISLQGNKTAALHRTSVWKRASRCWQLYLLLLVPVIYLLIFKYYPMFGVQIAFKDFSATKGIWASEWVGLKYFKKFFSSYMFARTVTNTIRISLYGLAVNFPLAILLALFINSVRSLAFKKTVQLITYVPHFISTVVLVGMIFQILSPVTGMYGSIYRLFFGEGLPADILGKPDAFIHLYIWSGVWQGLGWNTIIYIAALSSVDPELHEAAQIDGASRFKRVRHIDLPTILPTASIMLILNAGSIMSVGFEKIYLMQNDLNLRTSEVISTYVYKVGMAAGKTDYSYASAIGLFNSIINCGLLVLVNAVTKRISQTSLW